MVVFYISIEKIKNPSPSSIGIFQDPIRKF